MTATATAADPVLAAFADEVGAEGPVVPVGGRTHWHLGGGDVDGDAREVRAPSGVVRHEPEELIVRVRAGTTVAELDAALAEKGQMVPLDPGAPQRATVGGVLAAAASGLRRLRYGPVRDTVLEVRYVSADGRPVKAGGPVVKNVTGFDLCRLLVGSHGTLGVLAEVVLRCLPMPPTARWLQSEGADPFAVRNRLYRPSAVVWDGATTWVLLEGHHADVEAQTAVLGRGWEEVAGPPAVPSGGRRSLAPGELRAVEPGAHGGWLAEVGVGTVHTADAVPRPAPHPSTIELHRGIKAAYDPAGRLSPGRRPW